MTKHSGGATINQGGASKATQGEQDAEFDSIAGNVAERDERPSPGKRERGETTSQDVGGALDVDAASERAS